MTSKTRTALLLGALLVLAGVFGGCEFSGKADPAALERTWVLKSFGAPVGLTPADPAVTTEMALKAGKASGSGGVNSFSGAYEAKGDGSIRFGQPRSTMMAGPPEATEQERAFFSALEKAESFEFNEGKLVLSDSGNNTLMVLAPK